ncbi:hypothetical protein ACFL1X_10320 [Candidatus Hydrogenedentota bacterium]
MKRQMFMAIPRNGFEQKMKLSATKVFAPGTRSGMHTYDDAFSFAQADLAQRQELNITDVMSTLLNIMRTPVPDDVDGVSCLENS